MPITRQRALEYVEIEWGSYVERFYNLPEKERNQRVKDMGYESFRDLLAHILGWWEEGMDIILAIAEERQYERKKYDFDVFNAESVARYKSWNDKEFMAQFEKTRQKMGTDLRSMKEAAFENRRVKTWIQGIIIHHAREHLITPSLFLVMDMLENEWGTYIEDFNQLDAEKKQEFLSKQGFKSFHDLLAHIVGWWEDGARVITGVLNSPNFTWEEHDVDAFNAELLQKYSTWSDEDIFSHFEFVRQALLNLIDELPDNAPLSKEIETLLKDDVIEHYDEHPIPS